MSSEFDTAVLIGRFQPFHQGHAALLSIALNTAPKVTVVLGSAFQARSAKNPFTWEERAAMIACTLSEEARAAVRFAPVRDYYDDPRWSDAVSAAVQSHEGGERAALFRTALIGHLKDASSHYLHHFPEWKFIGAPSQGEIDATSLRRIYFESGDESASQALLAGLVPPAIVHYLKEWSRLPHFARLKVEHVAIEESKKEWGLGPFVAVDALVHLSGHVLLVRRDRPPGKDLWALPGGYLEPRERVLQGALRELHEETGLGVPESTLVAALRSVAVFDHPDRSLRGRTLTHAHYFALTDGKLPAVAGADDAAEARWFEVARLPAMEGELFEDHFHILDHFLGLTRFRRGRAPAREA